MLTYSGHLNQNKAFKIIIFFGFFGGPTRLGGKQSGKYFFLHFLLVLIEKKFDIYSFGQDHTGGYVVIQVKHWRDTKLNTECLFLISLKLLFALYCNFLGYF